MPKGDKNLFDYMERKRDYSENIDEGKGFKSTR